MKTLEDLQHYRPQPTAELRRMIRLKQGTLWLSRYGLEAGLCLFLLFNLMPWFAPVFMKLGWTAPANAVYTLYSPLCHQMAQRSFFLFGEQVMYSPDEFPLQLTEKTGADALLLRRFRGNTDFGWKVAWSDRMVSMYGGLWLAMLLFTITAHYRQVRPLSLWIFALTLVPMLLDGGTHTLSDLSGLQHGFRYDNAWLASLTGSVFPSSFYHGDGLGSFNSWMRLFSGIAFGFGVVWFIFPYLLRATGQSSQALNEQLQRAAELYDLTNEV